MLLANKFFDLVIGVDFHATTSPPFNPVHPFIGFTLDISAYIPFIGATTFINKVPYGNSGTMGTLGTKAHIPLVGSFAMAPMVAHESTNFFGSMNTFVEGMRLSGAGFMVMSCNDVGVPLSMQPGTKGKKLKPSLFAPTSVTIPIPKGSPVMVGGPYVPDVTAMLKSMVMGFGMGCLMKGIGGSAKKIAKLANAKNKQARNLMSGIVDEASSKKLKKLNQLKKNNKNGKLRELKVRNELTNQGHTVIGSQVSVKTKHTRRVVDHMIIHKETGKITAVEVKSGNATRSKTQVLKDNSMAKDGGTIIGKNAPVDLQNTTIEIDTIVVN